MYGIYLLSPEIDDPLFLIEGDYDNKSIAMDIANGLNNSLSSEELSSGFTYYVDKLSN